MWDLQERAQPVDKVDILLSQQQAQTAQLSQLLSQAGGHGAKLELLAEKLTDVVGEMGNVKRHISECPARAGYDSVKTRLDLIEKISDKHDDKLNKKTPKNGMIALPEFKGGSGLMRLVVYIIAAIAAAVAAVLGIN